MGSIEKAIRAYLPSYEGTKATKEDYEWLVSKLVDSYENEIEEWGLDTAAEAAETIDAYDIGEMVDAGSQKMINIYDKLRFGDDYEEDDDELEESVNTNETRCYNTALELAKKTSKPVVYGYTKGGKFYSVEPTAYHGDDKAFRSQYSANVIHVAYPDKNFIEEKLTEDYDELGLDKDLLDMLNDDGTFELNENFKDKKQRCIDMYNQCKDWDDKAMTRVSCLCNVDENVLKEWLNEVK